MTYAHSRRQKLTMLGVTLLIFFTSMIFASAAMAQAKFELLHAFGATGDGNSPWGQLLEDKAGNLYGTTVGGGAYNYGSVFELSRSGDTWTENVLFSFQGSNNSLQGPQSGLVMDRSGNLFGTTTWGGYKNGGTIFELSYSNGSWVETSLYILPEASNPGGLLRGGNGSLYGTALWGQYVYQMHPPTVAGGSWTGGVLFKFNSGSNGYEPLYQGGALITDNKGNLYGTTAFGGAYGDGEVFELSPPATPGSQWTESVLYSFGGYATDGFGSDGAVVMDAAGNLYGTTTAGGANGPGTVWELSPPATQGQPWTETILHNFAGGANDGASPYAGLVMDKAGNLYGVTYTGGPGPCYFNFSGCGTVFELSPAGGGTWTETLLHVFHGATDGAYPYGGLMLSNAGYLYGTTSKGGGVYDAGTAFEIQP
jgi:uncharacterized repeat protein (TIGR03803 family)